MEALFSAIEAGADVAIGSRWKDPSLQFQRQYVFLPMLRTLRKTQEKSGAWVGRWGVNYLYGTWQVLRGMRALNVNMNQAWLLKGREWLESVQREDGGWGERCITYDDPVFKGQGPVSTASQRASAPRSARPRVSSAISAAGVTRPRNPRCAG